MDNRANLFEQEKDYQRYRQAFETLKVFMADAKEQLKTSIPLSTLELIVGMIEKE